MLFLFFELRIRCNSSTMLKKSGKDNGASSAARTCADHFLAGETNYG